MDEGGDWRNIQDVVRQTFRALHEVVRVQGERIRTLEQKCAHSASSADLDAAQVAMSTKPTFAEMNKAINVRLEELHLDGIRAQISSKASKNDLKSLYEDMTLATQRLGDGSNALELLVRQQQNEIDSLKKEMRKLSSFREQEEQATGRLATRSWVEEVLEFETESRKQGTTSLRREINDRIGELQSKVDDIPTVSTLDEVLSHKVDMNTLTRALQDRPTTAQMLKEVAECSKDAIHDTLKDIRGMIENSESSVLEKVSKDVKQVEALAAEKISRSELLEVCSTKVSAAELDSRLLSSTDALATEVKQAIVTIQKELVQVLNKKAFKADVAKQLEAKASVDDVQAWLSSKVELVDVRDTLAYKADLTLVQESLDRIRALEESAKPTRGTGRRRPRGAMDETKSSVQGRSRSKTHKRRDSAGTGDGKYNAVRSYLEKTGSELGEQDSASDALSYASDTSEPGTSRRLLHLLRKVQELETDKVSVKDVCVLLDQKANIKDVNQALAQIASQSPTESLERKSEQDEVTESTITQLQKDIAGVTEAINAELSTGRWIWSSGRALPDRAVPWNIECINTGTDNFIWKQDSPDIVTVMPGLYELHLGFFTDSDPDVQVLVNGEPIFYSATKSRNRGQPPLPSTSSAPRRLFQRAKHSAGNITGWTAIEFVALPARARLTVLYQGDMGTQGFIGLRKL